jgi:hypothetical protein
MFVALIIQHADRMRRIILPSVACLALPYFFTYHTKGMIFGRGKLLNIEYVLISLTTEDPDTGRWQGIEEEEEEDFSYNFYLKHFSF